MALGTQALFDAVQTHAMTLGQFERVNTHEPKNAPGNDLSCAIWIDRIRPATGSGLAATSALVVFNLRIYSNMLQEPQDAIDPNITLAVDALINAYSGDFTLGGTIRMVDLLGMSGIPLESQAGYLDVDGKMYRIVTVTLPLVVNDAWAQVA